MKFKSENMTQASGSIAGVTYAHTKGGVLYRRARAIPTNPASANQTLVRTIFTFLVNYWQTLSASVRNGWETYAANVTVVNSLGDAVNNSGFNWFIAVNTPRLQSSFKLSQTVPLVDTAPSIFNRGSLAVVTTTPTETSGLSVAYDDTEDWADVDGAALFVYQGKPVNATRNFFKGPYRLVGVVLGDSTTPPTSPLVIAPASLATYGYSIAEDQAVAVAVSLANADGRLTSRQLQGPTVVGA